MDRLFVTGGARLAGSVRVSGAKNSALKLMAGALLAPGRTVLTNVPRIQDCLTMAEVLRGLGVSVDWDGATVAVDATSMRSVEAPYELVRQMRASIVVLGPLLARAGSARVAMPGGDNIGSRPIDLHITGLRKMGAQIHVEHGFLHASCDRLHGTTITLDYPSVGATENLMMAAVAAKGTTVIDNAAREPEIQDVADFLVSMGARIAGAGSSSIEIDGVEEFTATEHSVIPDRIEAGTWAIAACATRGDVVLRNARPDHLELLFERLAEGGADVSLVAEGVRIRQQDRPGAMDFVTLPYPGLATDFQPILMALLCTASGTSIATENVFEGRFLYVDELRRMGADVRTEGHHAVIRGIDRLSAAPVRALDIRAGAAMVVAALTADGVTEIVDMHHVDRGYEGFEEKLSSLGAEVRRERELSPATP
ncbi:MAG TPA: UDP-N-acetylglucosamine 1-carboxyvinyltransferase [Actinomycetota bacterium]|jgi:UDP-N-acetylglucosamine 1-carboxyvinyltransferase|nr:UDP-N-acetylglucosamine 1-carboxyvinyltransferase [Actinomycetota bacterium]